MERELAAAVERAGAKFCGVESELMVSLEEGKREEDRALVARAQKGDREAFRELVERYQGRVFSLAFDILKNREDAEDVVQESFVKAYVSLKSFQGNSSFYTWLYRIVYNMAIDVRRKVSRHSAGTAEFEEQRHQSEGEDFVTTRVDRPDRIFESNEDLDLVQRALDQLSEEHRLVILLRERDGLSYDEIADVVGIARGTVMSRLHYARKELLRLVESFRGDKENGQLSGK